MAKTRAQTRAQTRKKTEVTSNQINNFKKMKMKECCIRLDKLTPNQINEMINKKTIKICVDKEKKTYELRKRVTNPVISIQKPKKSINQIVAMSQSALHTSKAIRLWDKLKKQYEKKPVHLYLDQVVCARMSGYRPWPAEIKSFEKNGVSVLFFGTYEKGLLRRADVLPYETCKEVIDEYLQIRISEASSNMHVLFVKACRETSCIDNVE